MWFRNELSSLAEVSLYRVLCNNWTEWLTHELTSSQTCTCVSHHKAVSAVMRINSDFNQNSNCFRFTEFNCRSLCWCGILQGRNSSRGHLYSFRTVKLFTVELKVAEGHGIMVLPPGTNSGIPEFDSVRKQRPSAVILCFAHSLYSSEETVM